MVTTPIRKKEEIVILKKYFLSRCEYRDYALFVIGINTALRISDLLVLRWEDVYDFNTRRFAEHIRLVEQKTGKRTCIILNTNCKEALTLLLNFYKPESPKEYLFFTGKNRYNHIGRNRAYHIIKNAALTNKIEGNISCHSLRKTFGYHAWKAMTPPALIMNIYNHSDIETTKRYLSIDQDERDDVFIKLNL